MRISDWSSDVCSSDLVTHRARRTWLPALRRTRKICGDREARHGVVAGMQQSDSTRRLMHCQKKQLHRWKRRLDRKSVVKGKSVSVRVAQGGRRIIQKKKKKKTH